MQICSQILKINTDDKVAITATTALDEREGDPALTISEIWKFLGLLGDEAEESQRMSPAPYQNTHKYTTRWPTSASYSS